MKKYFFQKGFTLIETIIYIALFVLISLALTSITISVDRLYANIQSTIEVESSALVSLDRMSRDIRNGVSIVASSTFGVSPGRLVLSSKDRLGTVRTVEYYVLDGMLRVKENDIDVGQLTSSSTPVSNLVFIQITTPHSTGVKIDMSLQAFKNGATSTEQFWGTYVLRGSY